MDRDVYARMAELEDNHWWFKARRRIVSDIIARKIKPSDNALILEAGCGTGGNLAMLTKFGEVSGFEPDAEARGWVAEKSKLDIKNGFLPNNLSYGHKKFDLIVALDVLEHVEEDQDSMQTLLALLKPGGALLVTVPAFPFLWSKHDELHHHKRRYTRAGLKNILTDAGGQIEMLGYFNTFLFPLVAGLRMLKKLIGKDQGHDDAMPSAWLNACLRTIFASERYVLGRIRMPVGVSLLAIARNPYHGARLCTGK